jgi:F-type H+-transporting ATPase subunit delta
MADRLTVARPYAKAAFKQATTDGRLGPWSEALAVGAQVVADPRVRQLIGSPRVSVTQLTELVAQAAGSALDEGGRRFLALLAENKRLPYLPEISRLFNRFKDEAEGVVDVQITSAAAMGTDEQQKLQAALEQRFGRKVRVHAQVDPDLIAGAIVRAGDLTIDGSYQSRLERLAYELIA